MLLDRSGEGESGPLKGRNAHRRLVAWPCSGPWNRQRGYFRTSVTTRRMYSMPGSGSSGCSVRQCASSSSKSASSCSWTFSTGYLFASFRKQNASLSRGSNSSVSLTLSPTCWVPGGSKLELEPIAGQRWRRKAWEPRVRSSRVPGSETRKSSPRGTSVFSSRAMTAWKASSRALPNASVT
jgi:hypothetical protein